MKGVIFTEFIEMVEEMFSMDMVDEIIEKANLPSGGVYTAVGTYDHAEMVSLIQCLEEATGMQALALQRTFGERLFGRFYSSYPRFFDGVGSVFQFLQLVEGYIHIEVRKLYPDAELPRIETVRTEPNQLTLIYQSSRPFASVAEGLIDGCIAHFGESIEVQKEDLSNGGGTAMRFELHRKAAVP